MSSPTDFPECDFRMAMDVLLTYDNLPRAVATAVSRSIDDDLTGAVLHAHVGADIDFTTLIDDPEVETYVAPSKSALYRRGGGVDLVQVIIASSRICNSDNVDLRRIDVYFNPYNK